MKSAAEKTATDKKRERRRRKHLKRLRLQERARRSRARAQAQAQGGAATSGKPSPAAAAEDLARLARAGRASLLKVGTQGASRMWGAPGTRGAAGAPRDGRAGDPFKHRGALCWLLSCFVQPFHVVTRFQACHRLGFHLEAHFVHERVVFDCRTKGKTKP